MGYTELEKHIQYKNSYESNKLYWGLGIEEESYLQFTKPIHVATPIIRTNHAPERYSVRYFDSYKPTYKNILNTLFPDASGCIPVPFFINSHAFRSMDTHGNHMTTYEAQPKPNPKFTGKTFYKQLMEYVPPKPTNTFFAKKQKLFFQIFNASCIFDGDTLEFMTRNFFNTNIKSVIKELTIAKKELLDNINNFLIANKVHRDKGLLMYPIVNPGFTVLYSNSKNITMFNNGTYHINITLPSYLGNYNSCGYPNLLDSDKFRKDHQKFIRFIQWLEPFIIGVYGTKDPFSSVSNEYSKSSQRCAISRYIGIGTYDTNTMPTGKILTAPIENIRGSENSFWWYKKYHETSGYKPLKIIGMDINYRKHYNHGVEIRFLDWFSENKLQELLEFYVYLADASLERPLSSEPVMSELWNIFVVQMLQHGPDYIVPKEILDVYETILGFPLEVGSISNVYKQLRKKLKRTYKNRICAKCML